MLSPRMRAQIIKELLSVWRDPKSRFVLIGPPLLQLFIFSFAATLELRNVDIGVLNRDSGHWGYELVARIGAAGFVNALHPARSAREIRDMIDRREVIAAIDVPEEFSRSLVAQRPAAVQVILDGRRANSAQILLGYLNTIIAGLGEETRGRSAHQSDGHGGAGAKPGCYGDRRRYFDGEIRKRGCAREKQKIMNNGSQRMVGGERVQFGVEIHIRGVDPDACAVRVSYFHIRMNLCDRHRQRGTSVHHGVFAKEDDLAGCR